MTAPKKERHLLEGIWDVLISVKLTVVVLISIAVSAIIGTVIPQNRPLEFYRMQYGESMFNLITNLTLYDMYHSLWFQALILILAVNILACSWDRLKIVARIVFPGKITFSAGAFKTDAVTEPVTVKATPTALVQPGEKWLARKFAVTRIESRDNGYLLFAEKGRRTRLGVYVVHLSVLLLLGGALLGSFFGFEGNVNIPEGEVVSEIPLRDSSDKRKLGFQIRCDDFTADFYPSGRPKDYRSTLSIIEDGQVVLTRDIRVNDPLNYQGIRIFQSSYGTASADNVTLTFTSRESGMTYERTLDMGQTITLPEQLGKFTLAGFRDSYLFQMGSEKHDIGETLIGVLENKEEKTMVPMPVRFERFDKMRGGRVVVSVMDFDRVRYTGLQIRKDPGVPVVYASFILMILGIYITFFMSHQRFCVQMINTEDDGGTRMQVFWKTSRNEPAARKKAAAIQEHLSRQKP
ncbi:MAG: cytochrome c biogenesis protein ResB [Desulfosudaceae bacterium]